jgi:uncharacterized protein YndB with AHSA1/START domain
MPQSRHTYWTYIRATQKRIWDALIEPEFTRQYAFGTAMESEWREGSAWRNLAPGGLSPGGLSPGGLLVDSGEVLAIDAPNRLVLSWRQELEPSLRAEGHTRLTYTLEAAGSTVKLTVIHESDTANSPLVAAAIEAWPLNFASLKSLLETGEAFEETRQWPG